MYTHTVEYRLAMKEDTRNNMNGLWKHYVKQKKSVTKDHMLYDSIYVKC